MTSWTDMAELLNEIPHLPGARCKGRADLFEATVDEHVKPASRAELARARAAALRTCAGCPALYACRTWLSGLRVLDRPRGVVAGLIVRSTGQITHATLVVVEVQDDSRIRTHAALVCHRSTQDGPIAAERTYWDTVEQARQAEAELTPCGPLCIGVHTVGRLGPGRHPKRAIAGAES